jgi:hypothetical protein
MAVAALGALLRCSSGVEGTGSVDAMAASTKKRARARQRCSGGVDAMAASTKKRA